MLTLLALSLATLAVYEVHNRLIDAGEIREALRLANISIEKACWWMVDASGKPKDRALLERQLHGDGHLRHTDLCKLPVAFWQHYCLLMLSRLGLPREVKRAVPIVLALAAQKRMLRASLQTKQYLAQRKGRVG